MTRVAVALGRWSLQWRFLGQVQGAFLAECELPYDVVDEAELRALREPLTQALMHTSSKHPKAAGVTLATLVDLEIRRIPFEKARPNPNKPRHFRMCAPGGTALGGTWPRRMTSGSWPRFGAWLFPRNRVSTSYDVWAFRIPAAKPRRAAQVPDLVGGRRVLVHGGDAYVPSDLLGSVLASSFRDALAEALVMTAGRWAMSGAARESARLAPIIRSLSERCVRNHRCCDDNWVICLNQQSAKSCCFAHLLTKARRSAASQRAADDLLLFQQPHPPLSPSFSAPCALTTLQALAWPGRCLRSSMRLC
jgi:Eukaryotic and archaeal DNA primase, large subunit